MTTILALVLCLLLPGIAGGVLLTWSSEQPSRPGSLLLRSLASGVTVWLLSSGLLARTVGITKTSAWVAEILLGLVSVVIIVLPRSRRVLRAEGGEGRYFAALVGVTGLAWLPVGLLIVKTTWGPLGATPWYYWSLAQRVADAGTVPSRTMEWATTLPFLDDYRLFSTGTAMMLVQGGHFDVRALQAVVVVSIMLLGCGSALLANALGSGRLASLVAAPMAVATGVGAVRVTSYRPEALGLGMTLLVVACFVDWFRSRERASLVAGCLLGLTLANVHGVALVSAVLMLVAASVATLTRQDMRGHIVRVVGSALALAGSVVVSVLLVGGASGAAASSGGLPDKRGLADPTWQFMRAIVGRPPSLPPSNHEIFHTAVARDLNGTGAWVLAAIAVAAVGLVLGLLARQGVARRALLFVAISLVGIAAVAAVFAVGWSSYVPRRVGARLVQEATLLVGPFVACGIDCLTGRLRQRRAGETWRRVVLVTLVALTCGLGFFFSARIEKDLQRQRPPASDVSALQHIGMAHDSVVLTNAYTEGYVEQVTGATGLLEGRSPYTFPRVLTRANRLLREAHTFFVHPRQNVDFLDRNHVAYVVVSRGRSYSLGTRNIVADVASPRRLDACPGLTRVLTTDGMLVYRVDR